MCAPMSLNHVSPRITAVLGPTNTGKTHFAIEGGRQRQQDVRGWVVRQVAGQVGDASLVQDPLELQFGTQGIGLQGEEAGHQPERNQARRPRILTPWIAASGRYSLMLLRPQSSR